MRSKSIILKGNGKIAKIRTHPADQPGFGLAQSGFSPKQSHPSVDRRVWRILHSSPSLFTKSPKKSGASSHTGNQNCFHRQIDSQPNRAKPDFCSSPWYFYERSSQPSLRRFFKSTRTWATKKRTKGLNLITSSTAFGLLNCLWSIALLFHYGLMKRLFPSLK